MKMKDIILRVLPLLIATAACAQTAAPKQPNLRPDAASIVGVWRAQADGLPFVTLTITNETGNLSGAVLFYFHLREEGKPVTSTPGVPEPLFNPKFDGKTLTFQVSHCRAHPPGTLSDPPVAFRLTLTGANHAGLVTGDLTNVTESQPGFTLVKTEY